MSAAHEAAEAAAEAAAAARAEEAEAEAAAASPLPCRAEGEEEAGGFDVGTIPREIKDLVVNLHDNKCKV